MNAPPFAGGRRLVPAAVAVALAGLALTGIGVALDPRRGLHSYLVAFTYWVGIAVAALILLMALNASNARFIVLVRRVLESIPLSTALFLVLFAPIALGMSRIFPWVDTSGLSGEALRVWQHRRPWLNVPFFLVRAGLYFAVWIAVSHLLHGWSVRQDSTGDAGLTLRQRRLSAGALPLVAIAITFAAVDWQMSLDQHLASTIFGVYYFAGSFVAAMAVLVLGVVAASRAGLFEGGLSLDHLHSLGKFLHAFVCFWGYIALSQYLLIWISNLPEEVPWYLLRNDTGWRWVGIFLVLFHFVIPFFALLSRDQKRRPGSLAFWSVWVLAVHYVDVYWVVMPRIDPSAPRPHWTDLTAFAGVGAAALAFTLWRMRGRAPVPVRDPYLHDSLRYEPQ